MSFTLKFGTQAGLSYQAIITQLYERWSEKTALKFEEKVKVSLELISENPLLHPLIDEILQLRKCIVHKNCSILYRVYEKDILIVCFWDNRQEPMF